MASAKPLDCSTVRKVSTSTASCSPWMRVAELATHNRDSLPGGTSRFRPGRVTVNTLYFNEGGSPRELAMTAPGVIGSMAREASLIEANLITSRRFMPNLVRCPRDDATHLIHDDRHLLEASSASCLASRQRFVR